MAEAITVRMARNGNPRSVSGRSPHVCNSFTPKGDPGHDRYWCGCGNTD